MQQARLVEPRSPRPGDVTALRVAEAPHAPSPAEDGRVRPENYPGEWDDLRRATRRRHLRRGLTGWSAAIMIVALSACTTTVALTAGGLVGYAGYSIYRLVETGKSWTAASYDFLFTPRKPEPAPPGEAQKQTESACSWSNRLRSKC